MDTILHILIFSLLPLMAFAVVLGIADIKRGLQVCAGKVKPLNVPMPNHNGVTKRLALGSALAA